MKAISKGFKLILFSATIGVVAAGLALEATLTVASFLILYNRKDKR